METKKAGRKKNPIELESDTIAFRVHKKHKKRIQKELKKMSIDERTKKLLEFFSINYR